MFPVRLIVIAGPAGSGKSTLANVVAEDLGVPHLDFDTVSREIMAIRQEENPELSEPELLEIFSLSGTPNSQELSAIVHGIW